MADEQFGLEPSNKDQLSADAPEAEHDAWLWILDVDAIKIGKSR